MDAGALRDPALLRLAGRFVWLKADIDDARNAELTGVVNSTFLPAVAVLDPRGTRVLAHFVGEAAFDGLARDLRALLAPLAEADRALARADAASAAKDGDRAAQEYRAALAAGGPAWSQRSRAAAALVRVERYDRKDLAACVREAKAHLPGLVRDESALDLAGAGLDCAVETKLPRQELEPLLAAARALVTDGPAGMGRAWLLASLSDAERSLGDAAASQADADAAWAILEERLRTSPSREERAGLAKAALNLARSPERKERAISALERAAAEHPDDAVVLQWLTRAYLDAKRAPDALAPSERSVRVAKPPYSVLALWRHAIVLDALDRHDEATAARRKALEVADGLSPRQRSSYQWAIDELRAALGEGPKR